MDRKKLAVGIAAVAAGLAAVVLTNSYINSSVNQKASELTGVAKQELDKVRQEMGYLQQENRKIAQDLNDRIRYLAQQQKQPEAPRARPVDSPLASQTPTTKRAITVRVDTLSAVGGMVTPGDSVDIITHLDVPTDPKNTKKMELVSVTLFQNVEVLSVNGNTQKGFRAPGQVNTQSLDITLALNPHEASLIAFVKKHGGKLQLLMRSPLDSQAYMLEAATWKALSDYIMDTQGFPIIGDEKKEEPKAKPKSKPVPDIEVFKGARF
ncbi:MAG: Flp pilus assembly protein CpaB [Candidatus Omnitrophota bacterium]